MKSGRPNTLNQPVPSDLAELVAAVRDVVNRHADWRLTARLVADALEQHLPSPDVLAAEQRAGDPDGYRSHLLYTSPTGRSRSSRWSGGQARSRRFTITSPGVCWGSFRASSCDVSGFAPPGDIHRVRNAGEETAISIHIYGTDVSRIGSSVRRFYDVPVFPADREAA
jgi:3-mercaptopropionate dioxygenase